MILLATTLLLAQHPYPELPREPLPAGVPPKMVPAFPRQYSGLDPLALFEKLRKEGAFPIQGKPTQARLLVQNMDADEDPEYVIGLGDWSYQVAIVMKQVEGKWWTLGTLMNRYGNLDAFVSLKPLVWSGTYDLIVRGGGSQGTGVGSVQQSVYRILRGNLYQVFTEVEEEWNWTSTRTVKIIYPEEDSSLGEIRVNAPKRPCRAHRWNPKEFSCISQACSSK